MTRTSTATAPGPRSQVQQDWRGRQLPAVCPQGVARGDWALLVWHVRDGITMTRLAAIAGCSHDHIRDRIGIASRELLAVRDRAEAARRATA